MWDLPTQQTVFRVQAHSRFVRGVVCDYTGTTFYSCSDDKTIKRYRLTMDVNDVLLDFIVSCVAGSQGRRLQPRSRERVVRKGGIHVYLPLPRYS